MPNVVVIHVSVSLCDWGKKGSGELPLVDVRKLHFWRLRLRPSGGPWVCMYSIVYCRSGYGMAAPKSSTKVVRSVTPPSLSSYVS